MTGLPPATNADAAAESAPAPLSQQQLNSLFGIDAAVIAEQNGKEPTEPLSERADVSAAPDFRFEPMEGLSQEVMASLARMFMDDTPRRMDVAWAALLASDVRTAGMEFHSIKGGAGYLGATRVVTLCMALEKSARSGSLDEVRHGYPELAQALTELCCALRAHYGPGVDAETV